MDRRQQEKKDPRAATAVDPDPESTIRVSPRALRAAQTSDTADVLDALPEAVLLTDLRGRILFVNRAGYDLLNVGPAEMLGRPLLYFVANQSCGAVRGALNGIRKTGVVRMTIRMRPRHQRPAIDVEISGRLGPAVIGWIARERAPFPADEGTEG